MINMLNIRHEMRHYANSFMSLYNDARQLVCLNKAEYKKYENSVFINRLYFEVTNICNAKCIFCAYSSAKHKTGLMKFESFKKAIDEYAKLGGKVVSFTPTVGEPLLDPGLLDKVKYSVNLKGIERVYFYANGILLAKNETYRMLIDSGITEINISMPEFDKEIYEKIYCIKAYDKFFDGIQKLLHYNKLKGNNVKICIHFRSASRPSRVTNSFDFVRLIKPFLGNGVSYNFMSDYDNWGGVIKKENLFGIMKLKRIPKVKILPCIRTFDASILFDGSVRLCACRIVGSEFDDLVIGNINEDSLEKIFFGEKAKEVRQRFVMRNPPKACKDCSLYLPVNMKTLRRRNRCAALI